MEVDRPYLSWAWSEMEEKGKWSRALSLGPTNGQRVLISSLPAQANSEDKTPLFSQQSLDLLPSPSQKHLYN